MKNILSKSYITLFFLLMSIISFAAELPGDEADGDPIESTDAPMPIDDYLWILVLIGLLFVVIKFRAYAKERNVELK